MSTAMRHQGATNGHGSRMNRRKRRRDISHSGEVFELALCPFRDTLQTNRATALAAWAGICLIEEVQRR
jgi:hypothetical protein